MIEYVWFLVYYFWGVYFIVVAACFLVLMCVYLGGVLVFASDFVGGLWCFSFCMRYLLVCAFVSFALGVF